MERLFTVGLIGLCCGMLGTGLGGFITLLIKKPTKRFMAVLLGFTSGIMLSVVCFDLLPEAFKIGGIGLSLMGIGVGVLVVLGIEQFLPIKAYGKNNMLNKSEGAIAFIKSGMLLGIGIAIHNFPEGLAVGSAFAADDSLGLGLAIVIGLHDMPEGIAMAAPLKMGGVNKFKVLFYTILAGIPMGIGAVIGELLGEMSYIFICLCLSFAGGTMLYITCGELIPKSQSVYKGRLSTLGMIGGIMSGIYIGNLI